MRLAIFLATVITLTGCVVHPKHHGKTVKVKGKTAVVLEREHKNKTVVVVKVKPKKGRKCWSHTGHWHCRR